ncbi:unnamed protein product, partial [Ectocarpus sp. 8 AP-2014]
VYALLASGIPFVSRNLRLCNLSTSPVLYWPDSQARAKQVSSTGEKNGGERAASVRRGEHLSLLVVVMSEQPFCTAPETHTDRRHDVLLTITAMLTPRRAPIS